MATSDPKLQELIVKGEELIQRGQELKDRGDRHGAYEKFYQGLQYLLKVMPGLGDANAPPVLALKSKIHGYLDETEKLKKSLDSTKQGLKEDLSVEARIERGETLMSNGQRLEKSGKLEEAYDKYCTGLKILLEVAAAKCIVWPQEDAVASRLRSKISGYLEEAERLKERRDGAGSDPRRGAAELGFMVLRPKEAGDALRLRLAAPHVAGNGLTVLSMARSLEKLRCRFLDAWDGDAKMLNLKAIFALRRRFPEAQLFLWQTSFSSDAFHGLCEPLASVNASPPAILRIGSVTLTLHLRLFTVSESYFDPARPLRRLLLKLDLQTQQGAILWPAGAPGPPESRHLCGEGHRWACVCCAAELGVEAEPLFCSLKECFLRPAWRDPRVLLHKERPLVHRCQELNGELLLPSGPLRVALAVYRADDDEGPDDP
ncbi:unnamed protein product [Durusdinium trenchii]|uniref:Uncharacterized protein n=1 Tax=Durusdinium trenchii TaxID=1381693 RepID=A0ABP0RWR8_9DINO